MKPDLRFPKVVACMPAWKAVSFVGPVLESLTAQTYSNLDVLISVDLCDDGTAELCESFAKTHPNFTVLRQPTRLGWVRNSNALIERAQGKYFFFAFHDDPLEPTYVSRLTEALEQNPKAVLAFSDMKSERGIETYSELEAITDRIERARRLLAPKQAWWVPNRGLFRADTAKHLRGLRRHLGGECAADWPWLVGLALQGEFVRVPEALVFKRRLPEGLNATFIRSSSMWKRLSVRLSCLNEIRAAHVPFSKCVELHLFSFLRFIREEWWLVAKR